VALDVLDLADGPAGDELDGALGLRPEVRRVLHRSFFEAAKEDKKTHAAALTLTMKILPPAAAVSTSVAASSADTVIGFSISTW